MELHISMINKVVNWHCFNPGIVFINLKIENRLKIQYVPPAPKIKYNGLQSLTSMLLYDHLSSYWTPTSHFDKPIHMSTLEYYFKPPIVLSRFVKPDGIHSNDSRIPDTDHQEEQIYQVRKKKLERNPIILTYLSRASLFMSNRLLGLNANICYLTIPFSVFIIQKLPLINKNIVNAQRNLSSLGLCTK